MVDLIHHTENNNTMSIGSIVGGLIMWEAHECFPTALKYMDEIGNDMWNFARQWSMLHNDATETMHMFELVLNE